MKTLYKQYFILTLIVILTSLTISMFFIGQLYNNKVRIDTDKQNINTAQEVVNIIQALPEDELPQYFNTIASLGYQLVLLDSQQNITTYGTAFNATELSDEMKKIVGTTTFYHGIKNFKQNVSIMNHYTNDIQNTVGIPFTLNNKNYALFIRMNNASLFTEMHFLITGFLIISAIIIFLAMLIVARQFVKPLRQLQLATQQIAQENYNVQVEINRKDELGELAIQFNKMAKRLSENDQAKRDFINNVSHDFQSPLLNIKGYANVLKDADNTEEERKQYLDIIMQETNRLSALTKQLLLLSSLDQKDLPITKKRFSLDKQLKELLFTKRWQLDDKEMELVYELESVDILADEQLIEQVWDNLLSNAIRYTEPKGKITITCSRRGSIVEVSIEDNGIGIPTDAIDKVKERFYRVDNARSEQSSGLGLAIVSEIIERHHGKFIIESELGKGSKMTVILFD